MERLLENAEENESHEISQFKMYIFSIFSVGLGLLCVHIGAFSPPKYSKCISKDFGQGGTVCLCSENECDSFSEGIPLGTEEYAVYTSSKAGERFSLKTAKFDKSLTVKSSVEDVRLMVNSSVGFQKILGFGGAFTGKVVLYRISECKSSKVIRAWVYLVVFFRSYITFLKQGDTYRQLYGRIIVICKI